MDAIHVLPLRLTHSSGRSLLPMSHGLCILWVTFFCLPAWISHLTALVRGSSLTGPWFLGILLKGQDWCTDGLSDFLLLPRGESRARWGEGWEWWHGAGELFLGPPLGRLCCLP